MKRKNAYYILIISLLFLLVFNIVSITNKVYGDAGTGGSCIGEHSNKSELERVSATCTTDGYVNWYCNDCGVTWQETLNATRRT